MVDRLARAATPLDGSGHLSGARLLAHAARGVWRCNRGMFWKAGEI